MNIKDFLSYDEEFNGMAKEDQDLLINHFQSNPDKFKDIVYSDPEYQVMPEEDKNLLDKELFAPANFAAVQPEKPKESPGFLTKLARATEGQITNFIGGGARFVADAMGAEQEAAVFADMANLGSQETAEAIESTENPIAKFMIEAGSSIISSAPGIALSAVSMGTLPAAYVAAPALLYAGSQAFGNKYQQTREAGYSPREAAGFSVTAGIIEAALETIPATEILAKGIAPTKKIIRSILAEAFEEMGAEALGLTADKLTDDLYRSYQNKLIPEGMTLGQAATQVLKSGLIGGIGGGVYGSGMAIVDSARGVETIPLANGIEVDVPSSMSQVQKTMMKDFLEESGVDSQEKVLPALEKFDTLFVPIMEKENARRAVTEQADLVPYEQTTENIDELLNATEETLPDVLQRIGTEPNTPARRFATDEEIQLAETQEPGTPSTFIGRKVAINPKFLFPAGGVPLNFPIDGVIVNDRGKGMVDVKLTDITNENDVIKENIPIQNLSQHSDAYKFDKSKASPTNVDIVLWAKKMMPHYGTDLVAKIADSLRFKKGQALGIASFQGGKAKGIKVLFDIPQFQDVLSHVFAHEIGHVLDIASAAQGKPKVSTSFGSFLKKKLTKKGGMKQYEQVIISEMDNIISKWRKGYRPGHLDADEMKAEVFSIWINKPATINMDLEAPMTKQLIEEWIARPENKDIAGTLEEITSFGQTKDADSIRLEEMFKRAAEKESANMVEKAKGMNWLDNIKELISDRAHALYSVLPDDVQLLIQDKLMKYTYSMSEFDFYIDEMQNKVMDKIIKADIPMKNFRAYAFHNRIVSDRVRFAKLYTENPKDAKARIKAEVGAEHQINQEALSMLDDLTEQEEGETEADRRKKVNELFEQWKKDNIVTKEVKLANPLGYDVAKSQKILADMEASLGKEKYGIIKKAMADLFDIRRKLVIEGMIKSGTLSPALSQKIRETDSWVLFSVVKFLNMNYGDAATSNMYAQMGTLADVEDPLAATFMKDMALIRSTNLEMFKKAAIKALFDLKDPTIIAKAPKGFKDVPGAAMRLWQTREQGVKKSFMLRADIARSIINDGAIYEFLNKINDIPGLAASTSFARKAFTQYNPGFWLFNIIRDGMRAAINLPGYASLVKFPYYWFKAIGPTWKMVTGDPDSYTAKIMQRGVLHPQSNFSDADPTLSRAQRILQVTQRNTKLWGEMSGEVTTLWEWASHMIRRAEAKWSSIGEVTEKISKIAASKYLDDTAANMSVAKKNWYIRYAAGSPSFLTQGRLHPVLKNIVLFANPFIQGWKTDYHVLKNDKGAIAKRMGLHTIGKLFTLAVMSGLGNIDWYEWWQKIPLEDRINFHIVPLGETSDGQAVYLRLPQDPVQQFFGALVNVAFESLLDPSLTTKDSAVHALDITAGQFPNLNPLFGVMSDAVDVVTGKNPYDSFRGRNVFDQQTFDVGGAPLAKEFGKHLLNKMGFSMIYKFKSSSEQGIRNEMSDILEFPFPVAQPVLNRFLRVKSSGLDERNRRWLKESRRENAINILNARSAVNTIISNTEVGLFSDWLGGKRKLTNEELHAVALKYDWVKSQVNDGLLKKNLGVWLRSVENTANTDQEKMILFLNKMKARNNLLPE